MGASHGDSSYCSACARVDSIECKRIVEALCKEGFTSTRSWYGYKSAHNYNANFLWKRLHRDAPRVCKIFSSHVPYAPDTQYALASLARVLVDQCESERKYKPCAPYPRDPYSGAPEKSSYGYDQHHHDYRYDARSGPIDPYDEHPTGYTHQPVHGPRDVYSGDYIHNDRHPVSPYDSGYQAAQQYGGDDKAFGPRYAPHASHQQPYSGHVDGAPYGHASDYYPHQDHPSQDLHYQVYDYKTPQHANSRPYTEYPPERYEHGPYTQDKYFADKRDQAYGGGADGYGASIHQNPYHPTAISHDPYSSAGYGYAQAVEHPKHASYNPKEHGSLYDYYLSLQDVYGQPHGEQGPAVSDA